MDFPIKKKVIFQFAMLNYQRVHTETTTGPVPPRCERMRSSKSAKPGEACYASIDFLFFPEAMGYPSHKIEISCGYHVDMYIYIYYIFIILYIHTYINYRYIYI